MDIMDNLTLNIVNINYQVMGTIVVKVKKY